MILQSRYSEIAPPDRTSNQETTNLLKYQKRNTRFALLNSSQQMIKAVNTKLSIYRHFHFCQGK